MRILHVVPTYIPAYRYGGPIRTVHGLCKSLAGLGHDVHVFTTNVDGPQNSDVPLETAVDIDGVKVWYFPVKYLRRLYWSPQMARALTERVREFNLVHLHSVYLWPTWAAARASRVAGVPYIVSPRGMLVRDLIRRKSRFAKSLWLAMIERTNLEHAAALHATSGLERDEILRFGYRFPPVAIVPNGVEPVNDAVEASPEIYALIKKLKSYLLYIGRINWKKGLDRLISAMQKIPDIHLVIAGNDEENYRPILEQLAARHMVEERVVFVGFVYGADKTALIKGSSVLILPSYSENFGNIVLEAMAQSCPVAVTPEAGVAEIVQRFGAGQVINGEPDDLAKGLVNMLKDPKALDGFGIAGRKAVEEYFLWPAIARQMENIYDTVLDGSISKRQGGSS